MDRNPINVMSVSAVQESLSARRAWIEMPDNTHQRGPFRRRSPQGERG